MNLNGNHKRNANIFNKNALKYDVNKIYNDILENFDD